MLYQYVSYVDIHMTCTISSWVWYTCGMLYSFSLAQTGVNIFVADPRELGEGMHELAITCMDPDAYVATTSIMFILNAPPPARTLSLACCCL